jgi:hypothetical protein
LLSQLRMDLQMAKRRNAKKEKADRNKINARRFRKPTSRYSGKGKRYYNNYNDDNKENNESGEKKSSDADPNKSSPSEQNPNKDKI